MKGKLVYMTAPMNLELREYDLPKEIEDGAILLEVLQTNVCGSEIHMYKGDHNIIKHGGIGHEMVGRIIKVGKNVKNDNAGNPVKIGDRVVPIYIAHCNHCRECLEGNYHHCEQAYKYWSKTDESPYFQGTTFATHYYVHYDQHFFKVPDSVTNQEASSANCALAQVLFGLDKVDIKPGQSIVIQGAGGLGLNACTVAKEKGATVIIIDAVKSRLKMAEKFGADYVIDMNEYQSIEEREQKIKELTNEWGADIGLEVTGAPNAFSEGIHLVKQNGKYVTMGNIRLGKTTEFDPGLLTRKSIQIIPVNRYNSEYLYYALQFLERNINKYPFNELTDAEFTLEKTQIALEKSINREVTRATIVVNN